MWFVWDDGSCVPVMVRMMVPTNMMSVCKVSV